MTEWLLSLPKTLLVILVLAAGILFIVLSDPPKNECDAQVDNFATTTANLLELNPKDRFATKTNFQKAMQSCQATADAGGCYEFFGQVRKVLRAKEAVSPKCFEKLGDQDGFSGVIWPTLDLMARLAWGEHAPAASTLKAGFLDAADLNLYCRLRQTAIDVYGKDRWQSFLEGYFTSLPEVTNLSRDDAWSKMLFSTNCQSYL